MSGGGGSGSTTTVQKADPWEQQKPFLEFGFNQAKGIYDQGAPGFYPGQTVAPISNETNMGLERITNRALAGSPMFDTAKQQLQDTASGTYLNSNPVMNLYKNQAEGGMLNANPYVDKMYDQAARRVTDNFNNVVNPGIESNFSGSGRYGSGAWKAARESSDKALGQSLGDLATNIYGGNYANERQLQNQAIQGIGDAYGSERSKQLQSLLVAPQIANQDYTDLNQLMSVGAQREGIDQQLIDADIARYNYNENSDLASLQDYMNLIQGNYGGTSTQSQSGGQSSNPFLGGLGGAISGGSLFGIPGAIGGGLLGAFF